MKSKKNERIAEQTRSSSEWKLKPIRKMHKEQMWWEIWSENLRGSHLGGLLPNKRTNQKTRALFSPTPLLCFFSAFFSFPLCFSSVSPKNPSRQLPPESKKPPSADPLFFSFSLLFLSPVFLSKPAVSCPLCRPKTLPSLQPHSPQTQPSHHVEPRENKT